jgi:adenylosuccinate synthase
MKELNKAVEINGVNKVVFNKMDILRQLGQWKLYDTEGQLREFTSEESMKSYISSVLPDFVREIKFSDNPHGF